MIANVRHQLGLDLPLPLQFWRYLTGSSKATLDAPISSAAKSPRSSWRAFRRRLLLMACGILVEVALGLTLRRYRGFAAQRLRRSHRDDVRFRRRVVAAIRGRAAAALCLRRSSGLVSDERLRHAGACRSAGADARPPGRRMVRANGAFGDDRRPQSGLRAHGSRQRLELVRASFSGTLCRTRFCRSSR